ncbi:DEAD/DEAH box helicase family protein [Chroococcidiopsis sp. CCNUC1]|uniref:DEAD/DEAH box helicase family protein n=1 Tax=Chroococcidiopsis sp. CCNUC1 TaxID=2653189 RepID=UPI002021D8FF|nr:DEAD/DEAH box helicase family protein [Chroococcidiopsis sp. CCNUC1]URD52950.1 DEAD/DEAH box helicase family protein [Chroococcidiopsis sp. CCNUC1]
MPIFQADPTNFFRLLQMVGDGDELSLVAGQYKGPFQIERKIKICGSGVNTELFAVDEPAIVVKVPGVRLENLAISRSIGGDKGEVVLLAEADTTPLLKQVNLLGSAERVQWEGVSWDIPTILDFGVVETNRQVELSCQLQLATCCKVTTNFTWMSVQPKYLSAGLQYLKVYLDSTALLPETVLLGSILLEATDEKREIAIAAKIIASQPNNLNSHQHNPLGAEVLIPSINTSQDWGYKFFGESTNRLIIDLEGKSALAAYPEFRDRLRCAEDLIFNLLGNKPKLFYVRRQEEKREPREDKLELTIATDRDDIELSSLLHERGKTLRLVGIVSANSYSGFRVISARLLPKAEGHTNEFATPWYIRLLPNHRYRIGVPQSSLERIATLPIYNRYLPTEAQLEVWHQFLQVEERIAEARQFCIPFTSQNFGTAIKRITFKVNATLATLDGSDENSLELEDFWQRATRAKNEDIYLLESGDNHRGRKNRRLLGCIEKVDPEHSIIRVELDSDTSESITEGFYQLPVTGCLFFEASGDVSQIRRKKEALYDLQKGNTQNPYLGEFFFDASKARPAQTSIKLQQQDLLLKTANADQVAAVETVLSAPDMILIQGPPGTGKTTVIAEICYQVALRGGRTLIASQANLAVDNALSRLIHNPAIRALRKGRANRVEEEGLPFLEERVIGTWLLNTANDCESRLKTKLETVQVYRQLLATLEQFPAYFVAEESFRQEQPLLQQHKAELESKYEEQIVTHQQILAQQQKTEALIIKVDNVLKDLPSVNWEDATFVNLLVSLQPYTSTKISVNQFETNVKAASQIACQLGLIPPTSNSFSVAAWLCDRIPTYVAEVRQAIAVAKNAAKAISDSIPVIQAYRENLTSLTQLKNTYQQKLQSQASDRQEIEKLQKSLLRIASVKLELDSWFSTSYFDVYQIVEKCVQERRLLTIDLIPLPSQLHAITNKSVSTLWLKYLTELCIKVNNLVHKYREWDAVQNILLHLESLLSQMSHTLTTQSPTKEVVYRAACELGIQEHNSLQSLYWLYQLALLTQEEMKRPPGIISWTGEILFGRSHLYYIAAKFEAIRNQFQSIIQKNKPNTIENSLREITKEVINHIFTNVEEYLSQRRSYVEQKIEHLQQEIERTANLPRQISTAQKQVEISRNNTKDNTSLILNFLLETIHLSKVPKELCTLAEQYRHTLMEVTSEQAALFSAKVGTWVNSTEQLIHQIESLLTLLDSVTILTKFKASINQELLSWLQKAKNSSAQLEEYSTKLHEIQIQIQQQLEEIESKRAWWQLAGRTVADRFELQVANENLFDFTFLENVKVQFESWQEQIEQEENYLDRYQNLSQDWITRIRHPSEQDRNELKQIYLDNTNVIGITCVQAASRSFSDEFKSFDVVIIDEVSKCTPPELLIPALKGKKLVLIGDYRQLPPMLNENTIEDIAEAMSSTPGDLSFLEESLFKSQFTTADDSIKQMLTFQYRMHPQIMGAINQFYDHRLQCGLLDPDRQRAHNLSTSNIQVEHHMIWVNTPTGKGFEEKQEGTSFINEQEVEAIAKLCEQMDRAWIHNIQRGELKKEIGIITFYGSQLRLINKRIEPKNFPALHIRTGTVDRFQGMERQVVIVSLVRNNNIRKVGFARKLERVNVAFSRAQELLIIVGSSDLFTQQASTVSKMYSEVLNIVRRHGGLIDVSHIL